MPLTDRRTFLRTAALGGATALLGQNILSPDLLAQSAASVTPPAPGGTPGPFTLYTGGKVTTMDPARADATAFAVENGRFVAVGTDEEILRLRKPDTPVVDLRGRRVVPGLTDSHTHTVRLGLNYALELRWDGVTSLAEGLAMIRDQVRRTPPGQWVRVVGGWSQAQFAEKRKPTLDELNALAPDTPVFVLFVYSEAYLNRAALRALGITKDTPNNKWPGGTIQRDGSGNPTGLLLATPSALVLYDTLYQGPKLNREEQLISTRHFMREMNRLGVTGSLDCGGGYQNFPEDYEVIQELDKRGEMTMRIGVSTFIQKPGREYQDFQSWIERYKIDDGSPFFRLLGGGEMIVRSIYDFEVWGLPQPVITDAAEKDFERVIRLLAENKWPFRFHCTYDETASLHLNALERVHREFPVDKLHWIIDHTESLSQKNMERIAALGGGVAIQNRIAFQEQEFLARYGPEKAAEAPPIKKMLAMGLPVGAGTDMSRVSSYNPWPCLHWLVTGKGEGGLQLLNEQTRLDRHTALKLWTDNAWFSREESVKGRIAPGLYADFTALSDDYFTIPAPRIRDLESVLTVVDGKVAHATAE
ncbi:MAG: amidohydrolase, partial [Opitutaceae bacterium]|nr:amidohydrolase [Opitutaceae bacterium]